jgi:hypothetical protein
VHAECVEITPECLSTELKEFNDHNQAPAEETTVNTETGYELDDRDSILVGHSGAQPDSYPMGTGGSFPGDR